MKNKIRHQILSSDEVLYHVHLLLTRIRGRSYVKHILVFSVALGGQDNFVW